MDEQSYLESADGVESMDGMDELFLDAGAPLQVADTTVPKGLSRRLEELQINGCCEKLAWSKFGCIAYVTRDGRNVKIQAYAPNFKSTPSTLNTGLVHGTQELVHVGWDTIGSTAVVVDAIGRISIYKTIFSLNRMAMTGKYVPNGGDAINAVVGLEWTSVNNRSLMKACHHAQRADGAWTYPTMSDPVVGTSHPLQPYHAMFVVTRGSALRLIFHMIYHGQDNAYQETSVPLTTSVTLDNLLSHASFAHEQGNSMILATYDLSHTLRLYRITVNWNYPYQQSQRPPPTFILSPNLHVERLQVLFDCKVPSTDAGSHSSPRLTHLLVHPALEDTVAGRSLKTEITAVYSIAGNSSFIARWELRHVTEEIHSSFAQLAAKKGATTNTSQSGTQIIQYSRLVYLPYAIIAATTLRFSSILAFCRSDGGVDFLQRETLDKVQYDLEGVSINTLVDAGFYFNADTTSINAALSPNACMIVSRDGDVNDTNPFTLRRMEVVSEHTEQTNAALAVTFATSCYRNQTSDDILHLIRELRTKTQLPLPELLNQLFMAIGARESIMATQLRDIIMSVFLVRVLSAQLFLGKKDESKDVYSPAAWMLLNIRVAFMTLYPAWKDLKEGTGYQTDIPTVITGLTKWYMDTITLFSSDLIWLSRKARDEKTLQTYLENNRCLGAIMILLNISRTFMRQVCLRLRDIDRIAPDAARYSTSMAQKWATIARIVNSSPVTVTAFDNLLAEVEHYSQEQYKHAGISQEDKTSIEMNFLITGKIPEVLMPVVLRLVTTTLNKLLDESKDPSKICFTNVDWVKNPADAQRDGVQDVDASILESVVPEKAKRKPVKIDVLRKVPLQGLKTLKKCTRCENLSEEIQVPQRTPPPWPAWFLQLSRQCPCTGPWVSVEN